MREAGHRRNRFNRYIVECKAQKLYSIAKNYLDLIDTLWNVKENSLEERVAALGFNRYIVECKGKEAWTMSSSNRRFNRYIVECKVKSRGNGARDLGTI